MTIAAAAPRLRALLLMLSSPIDAEALAAVRAIDRTLKSAGLDWHDFASALVSSKQRAPRRPAPNDDWRADLRVCARIIGRLTPREQDFIVTLAASTKWREPTAKQAAWLGDIAARYQRARSARTTSASSA